MSEKECPYCNAYVLCGTAVIHEPDCPQKEED